jgi:hypothetical protein
MDGQKTPTDPVALINGLNADQITKRLEELTAEEQALRVLLRSARARDGARRRHKVVRHGE